MDVKQIEFICVFSVIVCLYMYFHDVLQTDQLLQGIILVAHPTNRMIQLDQIGETNGYSWPYFSEVYYKVLLISILKLQVSVTA
jgi:hypothetical protein